MKISHAGLLIAVLAAGSLPAEVLDLPAEVPLGTDSQLTFELSNADLYLTGDVAGLPVLRARAVVNGESASLDVTSSGGSLTVRRAAGDAGGGLPRLRLDVALGPGRTVRVAGSDLKVRIDDALPEDAGRSAYRLALERSTAELLGARISELEATDSALALTATAGSLALTVTGGTARIQGHRGRLDLDATGAAVTVVEHARELASRLDGGSLEVVGGEGAFESQAGDAHLSLDGWRGPVEVLARASVITARGAEHRDRWRIDGRDLEVDLEGLQGTVEVTLEGGSLRASALVAGVQATAGGGARLELLEVVGGVTLSLADRAFALLVGVTGGVTAELTDSGLDADRVDQLKLTGVGADVAVRRVARLAPLEMTGSELALDLRATERDPSLGLWGAGRARVQLRAPCVVELTGPEADVLTPVAVAGCELRAPDRPREPVDHDGRPIRLTVTLGPDAGLEVEGEP